MDYPFIGITNTFNKILGENNTIERHTYPLCRQSPYKANKTQNMTIFCRPNTPPGRYVIVQQPITGAGFLAVCEIQVYAEDNPKIFQDSETCQTGYYGRYCDKMCHCYKDTNCDQNGKCPSGCDENWEGEDCNTRKSNEIVLIGCFTKTKLFPYLLSKTNNSCLDECLGYGYTFAAVLNDTTCLCTDNITWPASTCDQQVESCIYPPNRCNSADNNLLIFSVCPKGTYGYNCSLKCFCAYNSGCDYMSGSCKLGCSPGWTGPSCNIRDCTQDNGGCEANEICLSISKDVANCNCNGSELGRVNAWSPCIDINSPQSNTPAIIGGVVGGVGGLIMIVVMAILIARNKERLKNHFSMIKEKNEEVKLSRTTFSREEFEDFYRTSKQSSTENNKINQQYEELCKSFSKFHSNNLSVQTSIDENANEHPYQKLYNNYTKSKIMKDVNLTNSTYNFHLLSNFERSTIWNDIPDHTKYVIIFDTEDGNRIKEYLPKEDNPINVGNKCISLINEGKTTSGRKLEINIKLEQKKQEYENNRDIIDFNAYTEINDVRRYKIFIVDVKEDHMNIDLFMDIFQKIAVQENVTILIEDNDGLGNYFMAACNIISQYKMCGEVAIFQNLHELNFVTGYQPSLKSTEKLFNLIYDYLQTSTD